MSVSSPNSVGSGGALYNSSTCTSGGLGECRPRGCRRSNHLPSCYHPRPRATCGGRTPKVYKGSQKNLQKGIHGLIAGGEAVFTQRENQSHEGRRYIPSVRTNRRRGG
eukprot:79643-Prorocentrum_minimum.AAC.1